jgi:(heptosyl)LPS beta-1,4-glucosyltransferase
MVSVVIITKNEGLNIRDCLESCKWAEEIIIVDAESTDNTIEIAMSYTSKVFIRPWKSYHDAKNYGIDQARGEWILSLDADERLTAPLIAEIKDAVENKKNDGYYMPRLLYFCGKPVKHGGCYPDWQLRLFKKGQGRFIDVPIHEAVKLVDAVLPLIISKIQCFIIVIVLSHSIGRNLTIILHLQL